MQALIRGLAKSRREVLAVAILEMTMASVVIERCELLLLLLLLLELLFVIVFLEDNREILFLRHLTVLDTFLGGGFWDPQLRIGVNTILSTSLRT